MAGFHRSLSSRTLSLALEISSCNNTQRLEENKKKNETPTVCSDGQCVWVVGRISEKMIEGTLFHSFLAS